MSTSPPSSFPSYGQQRITDVGSEFNALTFLVAQILNRVQTLTLVEVMGVTNAGEVSPVGFVDVRPMVMQMTGDRKAVAHGTIFNIPYLRLQGGANAVILDPQVGDIGICGFASRDISAVKANKAQSTPGSFRTFDWADGLYMGGCLNGMPTQYVAFAASGITIHSPTKITLSAPIIEADASTSFTVTAPVQAFNALTSWTTTAPIAFVVGGLSVNGGFSFSGAFPSTGSQMTGTFDFHNCTLTASGASTFTWLGQPIDNRHRHGTSTNPSGTPTL
jgi:hypothetical protein